MVPAVLLLLLFLWAGSAFGEQPLEYLLDISFDIPASQIRGQARIGVKKGQELELRKGNLHILEVVENKHKIQIAGRAETLKLNPSADGWVEIRYVATFKSPERGEGGPGAAFRIPARVIDPRGILLSGTWYPLPDRLYPYRLTVTLPEDYQAVCEAESVTTSIREGRKILSFHFPHPLDSLTFVAGNRYRVQREEFQGTEILAYFFREDEDLARPYLEYTKKYLKLYNGMLGPYPYRRFCVVENFLPTGFSMPTYTLLGQEVVRLPFILETSLGHEILHQWFGNSVYIDEEKGNWAEGLTVFLADHLYEKQKGKGAEYRKGALIDYQSYVNPSNEFPLRDFRGRVDPPSQAIGYGKGLMVFQMLKNLVGPDPFREALKNFVVRKRFQKASWADLQNAFQEVSRKDLNWFFRQWVEEKGLLHLVLGDEVQVSPRQGKFDVRFTVGQKGNVFRADLPVSFYSDLGKTKKSFLLKQPSQELQAVLDDWPRRLVLDENYDLARTLAPSEYPPVIARIVGEKPSAIVPPPSGEAIYQPVIDYFRKKGAREAEPAGVPDEEMRNSSLVLLGRDNLLVEKLYGRAGREAGFDLQVKENPWNRNQVIAVISAKSRKEVDDAFSKVFHYGKYTEVAFDQGRNVYKATQESDRGMVKVLQKPAPAVEISTLRDFPEVLERAGDRKIIYVGENHDRFSHHLIELEVIKGLLGKNQNLAIGMEMFQRPFQGVLDEFIAGKIDEKEMLRKTEYFRRWKFDYHLYRPILEYARDRKIPLVALNQRSEIVEKVARGGLDSLSEEEKKEIPARMDFSDDSYRERLNRIYREHQTIPGSKFEFFYQAQILWDETMAESVSDFLAKNPDVRMVVLAGAGHLAFGSGIPKRTFRRNGFPYAILLNDMDPEKGLADYIFYPGTVPLEESPKLGVFLKEEKGQVMIEGFSPGSVAEKAGMRKGDILLSLDLTPVRTVEDARIEMAFREKGQPVKVKILRKELLGKEQEMEFEVTPR